MSLKDTPLFVSLSSSTVPVACTPKWLLGVDVPLRTSYCLVLFPPKDETERGWEPTSINLVLNPYKSAVGDILTAKPKSV